MRRRELFGLAAGIPFLLNPSTAQGDLIFLSMPKEILAWADSVGNLDGLAQVSEVKYLTWNLWHSLSDSLYMVTKGPSENFAPDIAGLGEAYSSPPGLMRAHKGVVYQESVGIVRFDLDGKVIEAYSAEVSPTNPWKKESPPSYDCDCLMKNRREGLSQIDPENPALRYWSKLIVPEKNEDLEQSLQTAFFGRENIYILTSGPRHGFLPKECLLSFGHHSRQKVMGNVSSYLDGDLGVLELNRDGIITAAWSNIGGNARPSWKQEVVPRFEYETSAKANKEPDKI
jgi:hypothetical protein